MPPKSIFRQPGTKHFQLVHRSQRDPLIHDPEASQHVLKAFERGNVKKGKSRADLAAALSPADLAHDERLNVGEASLYGIYYDDTEYDYMQHLRQAGVQEEGVDSVLIEAPSSSKSKSRGKGKELLALKDESLPVEALPSAAELPRNYEAQEAVPSSIAGFRPDMDPHLRQVLEALEDDAFVDDGLEDDFFGELVGEGERGSDEGIEFMFEEEGVDEGYKNAGTENSDGEEDDSFEARFSRFKNAQKAARPLRSGSDSESDLDDNAEASEGGDTIGGLPKLPVIGGKRRRKGASDASGYSMSSSSMFRSEALLTLDERFDRVMATTYASDEEQNDDDDSGDDVDSDPGSDSSAPELITSREDFGALMDDFLDNYEILGRKMRPVLAGDSGAEKLETLRRAMGLDARITAQEDAGEDDKEMLMPFEESDRQDRWDCETILTTYSNLENHPRLIRAREPRNPVPKIKLDPKTGMPSVIGQDERSKGRRAVVITEEENSDDGEGDRPVRQTATRPREESKEDKRARKQAVKAERQTRRADKKASKEQFSIEAKHQMKGLVNKERTKMRKL